MIKEISYGPWTEPRIKKYNSAQPNSGPGIGVVINFSWTNYGSISGWRNGFNYHWYRKALVIRITTPKRKRIWAIQITDPFRSSTRSSTK